MILRGYWFHQHLRNRFFHSREAGQDLIGILRGVSVCHGFSPNRADPYGSAGWASPPSDQSCWQEVCWSIWQMTTDSEDWISETGRYHWPSLSSFPGSETLYSPPLHAHLLTLLISTICLPPIHDNTYNPATIHRHVRIDRAVCPGHVGRDKGRVRGSAWRGLHRTDDVSVQNEEIEKI